MINLIYASDEKNGIGKDNTLPWRVPEDLAKFKELTEESIVVMGGNTWDSLPVPLKNRTTVVFSNSPVCTKIGYPDKHIKGSLSIKNDVLTIQDSFPDRDIFVIGGAYIYKILAPICDTIYHTEIKGEYDCDTFFDFKEHVVDEYRLLDSTEISERCTLNTYTRIKK